ncbi:hypothetical protein ACFQ0Q_36135 [Streptomyces aureus]
MDTWNYTAYAPHAFANNGAFQRVEGYEDLNPAKGKPKATTLSGLKVVDDLTFTVTLKGRSRRIRRRSATSASPRCPPRR